LTMLFGTFLSVFFFGAKWRIFAKKTHFFVSNYIIWRSGGEGGREREERERERERESGVCVFVFFCVLQMEEVHQKLELLQYPRASAPSQSLLYAGLERYELLQWLFFRWVIYLLDSC
jgi:hypothetical protein